TARLLAPRLLTARPAAEGRGRRHRRWRGRRGRGGPNMAGWRGGDGGRGRGAGRRGGGAPAAAACCGAPPVVTPGRVPANPSRAPEPPSSTIGFSWISNCRLNRFPTDSSL